MTKTDNSAEAPTLWQARRFEAVLGGGRTKPLIVDCERVEGRSRLRERFVVKAVGLPEVSEHSFCNEILGATIAAWFGVKAAQPAIIELSQEFVEATRDALQERGIAIRAGYGSGSVFLTDLAPMSRYPVLRDDDVAAATAIYALDMAIQNPDRRGENPNCGYHEGVLVVYDFENAFSFRFGILNPSPWSVTRFAFRTQHVFFQSLRAQRHLDWSPIRDAFARMAGPGLSVACGTMPEVWSSSAQAITDHVAKLAGHTDEFVDELQRSIA